jgi:hypothetical protein
VWVKDKTEKNVVFSHRLTRTIVTCYTGQVSSSSLSSFVAECTVRTHISSLPWRRVDIWILPSKEERRKKEKPKSESSVTLNRREIQSLPVCPVNPRRLTAASSGPDRETQAVPFSSYMGLSFVEVYLLIWIFPML